MNTDLIEHELHKILHLTFEAISDMDNAGSYLASVNNIAYKLLDQLQQEKISD